MRRTSPARKTPRLKRVWSRLRWQIVLGFLPLILIPVLATQIVARGATEQGLKLLVTQRAQRRALDMAQEVAVYYRNTGTWVGIDQVLTIPPWIPFYKLIQQGKDMVGPVPHSPADVTRPEQILIADLTGKIVASDGSADVGQPLAVSALEHGAPIIVNGEPIGFLVIGEALGLLNEQQEGILRTVNFALLASGMVSAALALALGLYLSWQITRPVNQLMLGVRKLSSGRWSTPLKVIAQNEFGDLTQAFNKMAAELTRQESLRRQMVADVAHDLRTPLTAMMLEIEAVEAGMQTSQEAAISLRAEIGWLQRLVEDLRLLSLMDSNQIRLQPVPVQLSSFLESVVDFFRTLAEDQERTLTLECTELPEVILDSGRMRQIMGNLIDNALRHTAPGGHILIRAETQAEMVRVQVTDDGEGIDPEVLPHIFDRFYRGDRARQHDGHGSGLGLSIVYKLVELHNGTISAESKLGHGSTFTVTLPCAGIPGTANPVPASVPRLSQAVQPAS